MIILLFAVTGFDIALFRLGILWFTIAMVIELLIITFPYLWDPRH